MKACTERYAPSNWDEIVPEWDLITSETSGLDPNHPSTLLWRGSLLFQRLSKWTVYCFSVPSGAKKIGRTKGDLQKRIAALQTGNHERITVLNAILTTLDGAMQIETDAHKMLAESRLCGEWFRCSDERALSVISKANSLFAAKWWGFYLQNVGMSCMAIGDPIWRDEIDFLGSEISA